MEDPLLCLPCHTGPLSPFCQKSLKMKRSTYTHLVAEVGLRFLGRNCSFHETDQGMILQEVCLSTEVSCIVLFK